LVQEQAEEINNGTIGDDPGEGKVSGFKTRLYLHPTLGLAIMRRKNNYEQ
jgi:hypothetical protein